MPSQRLPCVVRRELLTTQSWLCVGFARAVAGCATVDQRAGFSDITAAVEARRGKRVVWHLRY